MVAFYYQIVNAFYCMQYLLLSAFNMGILFQSYYRIKSHRLCIISIAALFVLFIYIYNSIRSNAQFTIKSQSNTLLNDWEWGQYMMTQCVFSRPKTYRDTHRLAVIVPIRDRFSELQTFLPHLERFLARQHVQHNFFIINQFDSLRFNRGALLNIGALESLEVEINGVPLEDFSISNLEPVIKCVRLPSTDYLALHDVDLLPVDKNLAYTWPSDVGPVHLIPSHLHPRYNFYTPYAGGILLIRRTHFSLVNGMSNSFWGWGREDDEFKERLRRKKLKDEFT